MLIETKLHPPVASRQLVQRQRLLDRLRQAESAPLTIIEAPPGWGKTTLLIEWLGRMSDGPAIAWVSLEPADGDPSRFWAYVLGAIRRAVPEVGAAAEARLEGGRRVAPASFLPGLVNELAARSAPLVLVLDDYHAVASDEVAAGMALLVHHQPAPLRIVIGTRSDPALPVGRLRAEGRLAEIRTEDLRFSQDEALALLNDVFELGLEPSDVALLHGRTEGWAAGLCLAGLSVRGHPDAHAFVASFAGEHRHIADYLAAEVLDGLPAPDRDFLLRTSILGRMGGPLCDAVTGRADSATTLERLERANLFIVPLDTQRRWYRYHRLFGRLLRAELERSSPGSAAELHARAAAWFRRQGDMAEAIGHALAGGQVATATALIEESWNDQFNLGGLATVTAWLDALPAETVTASASLCRARAWVAMDFGRLDEAGGWVSAAEAAFERQAPGEDSAARAAENAVLRAVHRFKTGDLGAAAGAARQVLAQDVPEATFGRTVAGCVLGAAAYWTGDRATAEAVLHEAASLASRTANRLGRGYCLGYLALAALDAGDPGLADARAQAALGLSDEPGFTEHFVTMVARLANARVALASGQLDVAEAAAEESLTCARAGAGRIEIAGVLGALAEIRLIRAGWEAADDLVAEAEQILTLCTDPGRAAPELTRTRAAIATAAGAGDVFGELTERELAVLRMLATTLSQAEIAAALRVSPNTVKTHARGLYRKIGASSRAEAVGLARKLGLL